MPLCRSLHGSVDWNFCHSRPPAFDIRRSLHGSVDWNSMIDRVTRLCYKVASFILKIFMNPRYLFIIYIIYLVVLFHIYPKKNHLLGGFFQYLSLLTRRTWAAWAVAAGFRTVFWGAGAFKLFWVKRSIAWSIKEINSRFALALAIETGWLVSFFFLDFLQCFERVVVGVFLDIYLAQVITLVEANQVTGLNSVTIFSWVLAALRISSSSFLMVSSGLVISSPVWV